MGAGCGVWCVGEMVVVVVVVVKVEGARGVSWFGLDWAEVCKVGQDCGKGLAGSGRGRIGLKWMPEDAGVLIHRAPATPLRSDTSVVPPSGRL